MNASHLTPDQRLRYSRQCILPTIGEAGQARICRGAVAVSLSMQPHELTALMYLVAAGVGELHLVAAADDAQARSWREALAAQRPDVIVGLAPSVPPGARHVGALPTTLDESLLVVAAWLKEWAATP